MHTCRLLACSSFRRCGGSSLSVLVRRLPLVSQGTLLLAVSSATGTTASFATPSLRTPVRWASGAKNPYSVLGIKRGATKEEIKKAYRVMARKHHPDAPGGDHKKFQEIQEAYEQIKSGVWIQKNEDGGAGAGGSGDGGGGGNRYSGFRYTTRTHHKSKVSYDEFYTEMHTGKVRRRAFEDEDDEDSTEGGGTAAAAAAQAAREARRNPFMLNEIAFQAWMRFIVMWCVLFTACRVGLFVLFPPKWEKPKRKPPPSGPRKRPPPPKPLIHANDPVIA